MANTEKEEIMKENEDGVNAGVRNFGRLALALIPWALGIGFAAWLGVWVALHQYRHELSQEDRAAAYVGATERPKSKMAIEIIPHDCTHITRADVDGNMLLLYARNDCHQQLDYITWNWQEVSPDGTIIQSGYMNTAFCPSPRTPGSSAECNQKIATDDRAKTIQVWTSR